MNPSSKKAVSGKRVATTFTGAAACAFAFVPPALAGTHQPVVQPGHQSRQARADIHKMRTASSWGSASASGSVSLNASIINRNCLGTDQSHWLHVAGDYFGNHLATCFGNRGTYHIRHYFYTSQECGGNNIGHLETTSSRSIPFKQGTTFRAIGPFYVKSVHISKWSGTDKCPRHP